MYVYSVTRRTSPLFESKFYVRIKSLMYTVGRFTPVGDKSTATEHCVTQETGRPHFY